MLDLDHQGSLSTTSGPVVMLEAALTAAGDVVALCVHVHDVSRRQVLRAPLPCLEDGASMLQLQDAAALWLAILDGNSRECRPD